jgi:hypothetical protein
MASILVNGKGDAHTYVIADAATKTLVAAESYYQSAEKLFRTLQAERGGELILQNITHRASCPSWLTDLVMADPEYRACKAARWEKEANSLRRQAEQLLQEAAEKEAKASNIRKYDPELHQEFQRIANTLRPYVEAVTEEMVDQYGSDLSGHCEEAAGLLAERLTEAGIYCQIVEGKFSPNLVDGAFSHFWVETDQFVLDPTASQFGEELPTVGRIRDTEGYEPETYHSAPSSGFRR